MTYSTTFTNIETETISATKLLPKGGIWKAATPLEQKIETMKTWLNTVSEIYGIEVPEFRFDTSEIMYNQTGGGHYEPHMNRITLFKKFSMVTLIHEFRHHMQHQMDLELYKNDIEEDARGWSVSLFKTACPKSYANSVQKGILHFS